MTTENKVVVENEDRVLDEDGEVDSGSGDIAPGDMVESYGNSDYGLNTTTVQENPEVRVARKAGEVGGVVTGTDANDTFASGDNVKVARCQPGVKVTLRVAAGADLGASTEANISEGDRLVTAGAADGGKVKAYDATNDAAAAVFAVATEAVDNSGAASGNDAEIVAEVL